MIAIIIAIINIIIKIVVIIIIITVIVIVIITMTIIVIISVVIFVVLISVSSYCSVEKGVLPLDVALWDSYLNLDARTFMMENWHFDNFYKKSLCRDRLTIR